MHLPGAVAHQRRQSRHRAASRLARRRAAPQGRGRDGRRQAARGGLHLVARSRRRLGRRRSRHQCRRAEGRVAAAAAHRPRQSPAGRAVARRAGAGQPLRGAGMPRRASTRSPRTRRTRRRCAPARSTCWRSTCSAAPAASRSSPTSSTPRCAPPRPMRRSTRADFDAVVDFVATGGYALKAYERFAKIRQGKDGRWRVTHPRVAQRYRMNVGTIVEADMLKVRLVRSRARRQRSIAARRPAARRGRGIFHRDAGAGRHLRVRRRDPEIRGAGRGRGLCLAHRPPTTRRCRPTRAASFRSRPISPTRVRAHPGRSAAWRALPDQVREWLRNPAMALAAAGRARPAGRDLSARRQVLSGLLSVRGPARAPDARHAADAPAGARAAAAARLRRQRICAGGLGPRRRRRCASRAASCRSPQLFDEDMLGDDLEAWLAESALMKRTFRNCAIIAGLIERRFPGRGEVAPPGHDLDRPRLRRAAQAPARPHPAARGARRRRDRPARHRGSAKCSRASRAESSIRRSTTSRRWRFR